LRGTNREMRYLNISPRKTSVTELFGLKSAEWRFADNQYTGAATDVCSKICGV
jgi:hypothetical protein